MTAIRDVIKTTLNTDAALAALITAGFFDANDLPQDTGGATSVPREADGVRVRPFGVIRWRDNAPFDADVIEAERGFFEVYLYQDTGYTVIDPAASRVKALLSRRRYQSSNREFFYIHLPFISTEFPAEEIGNAAGLFLRFRITQIRS